MFTTLEENFILIYLGFGGQVIQASRKARYDEAARAPPSPRVCGYSGL